MTFVMYISVINTHVNIKQYTKVVLKLSYTHDKSYYRHNNSEMGISHKQALELQMKYKITNSQVHKYLCSSVYC
jgi:hypothetical protein